MATAPIAFVVEDQPGIALLYSDALMLVGYQVKILRHGYEAINQLELATELPTLVVLDINLPGVTGDSILAHMRRRAHLKNVPVMVVTANSLMAHKIRPHMTVRDSLVVKPLTMPQLQAFAKQVLRSRADATDDDAAEADVS